MNPNTSAPDSLAAMITDLAGTTVLIVGDVMLDEYLWGEVERISPEAPVPIVEFRDRTYVAGGAANAAVNVATLSGRPRLGGVVGRDREAEVLRTELKRRGIDAQLVACDRPTTTKTRVLGGNQQILRIDREDRTDVPGDAEADLIAWLGGTVPAVDGILISDYGKGLVTRSLSEALISAGRANAKPIVVDPKGRDFSKYRGATVITPNVNEVRLAVEPMVLSSSGLEESVARLQTEVPGTTVIVTRGAKGASVFGADSSVLHLPARDQTVFDVTGAGDTFVATMALALGTGASLEDAARLSNAAAGIVVGKVGTSTVDLIELENALG